VELSGPAAATETPVTVTVAGSASQTFQLLPGTHSLELTTQAEDGQKIEVAAGDVRQELEVSTIPGWLSIMPPLVAIALALIFKDVILSLLLGVFSGAMFLNGWNPLTALARTIDSFIVPAVADSSHASILVFTTMLGGMVGLISKSGGTQGIVDFLTPYATNRRRGQIATWMLGVVIFFDDYANTLIVGSTMRPITDRLRISREKLAYIVDSTAAPVVSIFPISTWIGFEVGLIGAALVALDLPLNAYATFVSSIPYRFYPIFAVIMVLVVAVSRRDLGPMLKAERRAQETGKLVGDKDTPLSDYQDSQLHPPEGKPHLARNALIPILTVAVVTLIGLYVTGSESTPRGDYPSAFKWIQAVFSNADSYKALLWASLSGMLMAMAMALVQRILTVREATGAMVEGFRSMLLAFVVLILAWSIGSICTELHTADYLVGLTAGLLSPHWVPALTFVLAAAISFATGTAWGTMAIMTPLVIPIVHGLATGAGIEVGTPEFSGLLAGSVASVLSGSVWGDHCSPISDTTILSSMASSCDHIAHVRTQAPYALAIGGLAILVGNVLTALGLSPFLALLIGGVAIVGGVLWLGQVVDDRTRERA
jgi:Na+/H+ antiporter NhaC